MTLKAIVEERLADTETPVSAYHKLCRLEADSFLLESVEPHESVGRYSIVAFDPLFSLELGTDTVTASDGEGVSVQPAESFFQLIKEGLARLKLEDQPSLPSVGSLMGYIGYDAVRLVEKLAPAQPSGLPVARLVFPSRFVVFDNKRRVMSLVGIDRDEAAARQKIESTAARLNEPFDLKMTGGGLSITPPSRDGYMDAVTRAKEYIRAGDIFQVVLADGFRGRIDADPFNVYRLLRVHSPSPYMFYLNFGRYQVAGASPETLVKVKDGTVFLRPIAGTRGRSDDPQMDLALEAELMESEKERAEHVMLVDLARNDAGRVAKYGTISVAPYMTVERYSHVMHIVSQVQGELKDDAHAVDAFVAGFPAGTVSGAPKVRAMEIIDELEAGPRGLYSGAVGYFGPGNGTDTCIGIRMIIFEGDRFSIPVGAGIVADSDPEMEYQEIGHKAAQSIAALKRLAGEETC